MTVGALLGALALTAISRGAEDPVPRVFHYAALESAEDCRTYRDVRKKVESDAREQWRIRGAVKAVLRERYLALEQCAAANRLPRGASAKGLAAACPLAYRRWLEPGLRLRTLDEDSRDTDLARTTLDRRIRSECDGNS